MNTTGCPAGYATDEMFRTNTPQACDTHLAAYYCYTLSIVSMKFITAARMTQNWIHRGGHSLRDRGGGGAKSKKQAIPYGPLNMVLFSFLNLNIAVLGGLNIINIGNGVALALFSVAFLPFAYAYTYGLFKLVRLGQKIIPKSHRQQTENLKLARFDLLGTTMLLVQVSSILISSLVLIIIGPILPQYDILFVQLGFGFKSAFAAFSVSGYVYQFERCIRVIYQVEQNVKSSLVMGNTDLLEAVKKMRRTQALHTVVAIPSVIPMLLLASGAVPASVWVTLLPGFMEALGNVIYSFTLRGGRAASQQGSLNNSSKGNNNHDGLGVVVSPTGSGHNSSRINVEGTPVTSVPTYQGSFVVTSNES